MRIPRLFIDQPLALGEQVELPAERAHYALNVLRLSTGRPVILFNGRGGEYRGALLSVGKKSARVQLESFEADDRESSLEVELAIGISRGDKMDWIVQKATELGVTRIAPLYTERTEVKLKGDRQDKKLEHWRQVVVSACEQSQRNRLPHIAEPQSLYDFLGSCSADMKLILHPSPAEALSRQNKPLAVAALIGPEGGFSDEEIAQAQSCGFVAWQIGPRVLRTETAPVVALALLQQYWGDF